jgi:hypothetical protein
MQRKEGLVVRIQIKDEAGRVVGETDAVTFKGLLSLAHDEGLKSVTTKLLELPSEANGRTAVVASTVETRKGVFTGIGDANPQNVNRRIAPHCIRMAETRATARALRLAVNIGEVAIEELGDDVTLAARSESSERRPDLPRSRTPEQAEERGRDTRPTEADANDRRAMSEEQRKLLFRLAFELGATRDTAGARVLEALGVERFEWATRLQASQAIDALKREAQGRKGNGHGANGGGNHVTH